MLQTPDPGGGRAHRDLGESHVEGIDRDPDKQVNWDVNTCTGALKKAGRKKQLRKTLTFKKKARMSQINLDSKMCAAQI